MYSKRSVLEIPINEALDEPDAFSKAQEDASNCWLVESSQVSLSVFSSL